MKAELQREKPVHVLGRCQVRKKPQSLPFSQIPFSSPLRDKFSLRPTATSSHTPLPACFIEPEKHKSQTIFASHPHRSQGEKPLGKQKQSVSLTLVFSGPFSSFPPPHRDAPSDSTTLGSEPADVQQSQERIFLWNVERVWRKRKERKKGKNI